MAGLQKKGGRAASRKKKRLLLLMRGRHRYSLSLRTASTNNQERTMTFPKKIDVAPIVELKVLGLLKQCYQLL